jgi:putative Holliday junction resolvase
MRYLGIDYGSKRVGVAVSDPSGGFAQPVSVVSNSSELTVEIEKIAHDYETDEIVIGESRRFDMTPNDILPAILDFKAEMEKRGFTVHLELEFMTSAQAERLQGKHDKIDASAAAIILQSFLDRKNS